MRAQELKTSEPSPDDRACLSQSQRPKLRAFKVIQACQGSQGQLAVSTIARHDGALADNNFELVATRAILFEERGGRVCRLALAKVRGFGLI